MGGPIGFAISVAIPYVVAGVYTYCKVRGTPQSLPLDSDSSEEEGEERRAPLVVAGPLPAYWHNQDSDADFNGRYPVPDGVFEGLQLLADRTFLGKTTGDRRRLRAGKLPDRLKIVHAERIENRHMWAVYQKELKDIRNLRGSCTPVAALDGILEQGHVLTSAVDAFQQRLDAGLNEHYLWHGTTRAAADCISEDGFKIALAGSHAGTMFGRAAYFAESTSKADEYSQDEDGDGVYPLLFCRVICGEMYRTLEPCDGLEVVRRGQHDAILGDREAAVGTYREFVVFCKKQIYPEYKLLYQRVYEDDTGSE